MLATHLAAPVGRRFFFTIRGADAGSWLSSGGVGLSDVWVTAKPTLDGATVSGESEHWMTASEGRRMRRKNATCRPETTTHAAGNAVYFILWNIRGLARLCRLPAKHGRDS